MTHDSLVAINILDIVDNNKLLNKTGAPLLFYWDGESNVLEDIRNNEDFSKYCELFFIEPQKYLDIFMSYFYFKFEDDGTEAYTEAGHDIQDILYLENFNSKHIVKHFLLQHFLNLYKISLQTSYSEDATNVDDTIIDIYNTLKNKFKKRVSKETVINWVRSVLIDTNHFNTTNTDYIIKELTIILNNVE